MEIKSSAGSKKSTIFWIIISLILLSAVIVISFLLFRTEIESESKQSKETAKTIAKAIQKEEHPIYIPGKYSVNFTKKNGYWQASALACDEDLINLAKTERIKKLRIKNSEITYVGFETLLQEPIEELLLFKPHLTSKEMKVISNLKNLTNLSLRGTRNINDSLIASLTGPPGLKSLTLRDTGISNKTLIHVSKIFPNLTFLNLRKCRKVSLNGIKALARLSKLEMLKLNNIDLTKMDLIEISRFKSLRKLFIVECGIDDSKVAVLRSTAIKTLDLSENLITENSLTTLSKMKLHSLKMNVCPNISKDLVVKFKANNPEVKVTWSAKYESDDTDI